MNLETAQKRKSAWPLAVPYAAQSCGAPPERLFGGAKTQTALRKNGSFFITLPQERRLISWAWALKSLTSWQKSTLFQSQQTSLSSPRETLLPLRGLLKNQLTIPYLLFSRQRNHPFPVSSMLWAYGTLGKKPR